MFGESDSNDLDLFFVSHLLSKTRSTEPVDELVLLESAFSLFVNYLDLIFLFLPDLVSDDLNFLDLILCLGILVASEGTMLPTLLQSNCPFILRFVYVLLGKQQE